MIYVGTSGYNYKHWRGIFYPEKLSENKWLEYYCNFFDTVELNVTFYRLPQRKAFESWYARTPKDFRFAIKGSRFITHVKKLKDSLDSIKLFYKNTKPLKNKLSVTLWQLPPNLKVNVAKLKNFLKFLPKGRHAFEFREKSWFSDEVYEILQTNNAALVFADSTSWPYVEKITADFIYIRMHGSKGLYSSKYSDDELEDWAEKIKKWHKSGKDIYIYFNNDAYGFAVENTRQLKRILKELKMGK